VVGYETLLSAHTDTAGIRFFYDNGDLEIMTVSFAHEEPAKLLVQIVVILGEEFDIHVRNVGSATFKREALGKGFEPDQAFYISQAKALHAEHELTAETAPGPGLIIDFPLPAPFPDLSGVLRTRDLAL
jgi:Uma2 family endonuclease